MSFTPRTGWRKESGETQKIEKGKMKNERKGKDGRTEAHIHTRNENGEKEGE